MITSNAFAVLGLRTLFWVLASLDQQFDWIQAPHIPRNAAAQYHRQGEARGAALQHVCVSS